MTAQPRRWYRQPSVWIGLLISLASIVLLLTLIDIPGLLAHLRSANMGLVLVGFVAISASVYVRAVRWQGILGWHVNYWNVFHAENIGYLVNSILPLRAGEPARAYVLSRAQPGLSVMEALSTVVVARLVDMLAAVALLGLVLPSLDVPDLLKAAGYSLLALVLVALAMLVVGTFARPRLIGLLRAVLSRLPFLPFAERLIDWVDAFLNGLTILRDVRRLLWTGVLTAALWGCYALFYQLILLAFVPASPVSWGVLATCAAAISIALPSSPAYIGVFHAGVMLAMKGYLGNDPAAAYAIVLHTVELVSIVIFGLYSLMTTGTSLRRVNVAAEQLATQQSGE
ncbi:MAG: flippase-like domain-containing protein [Anaerolineae bacterium]|nr:flippase-like domain-containing protein [Anaerolineae bacterium]